MACDLILVCPSSVWLLNCVPLGVLCTSNLPHVTFQNSFKLWVVGLFLVTHIMYPFKHDG
jgi:hypothetical protein